MDNAKAIDLLDNLIGMIDDNQNNDYDAAFRMAIEALKAQLYREDATSDLISRQAAIEVLAKQMPRSYTPDGSHPGDEEIFKIQEIYVDCIESIEILPAVQPEIIRCKDCNWWTKQKDSLQGRCELMQMYPTGGWYCGNAQRRGGETE